MGRFVLIAAAIASALAASCYNPALVDCVDTCASHLCPDGLTCTAGFCRTPNATGTCSAMIDAAGSGSGSCPMAPQGMGTPACGNAMPAMPAQPGCFVDCMAPVAGSAALGYQVASWLPGALESAADETVVRGISPGPIWLGMSAPAGMGANPAMWTWKNGNPMTYMHWAPLQPVEQAGGNCASLTGSGWVSEACTLTHPFLIATPPP